MNLQSSFSLLCEDEIRSQWKQKYKGVPEVTFSLVWERMRQEDVHFFRAYSLRTRFGNQLMARAFLWAAMAHA